MFSGQLLHVVFNMVRQISLWLSCATSPNYLKEPPLKETRYSQLFYFQSTEIVIKPLSQSDIYNPEKQDLTPGLFKELPSPLCTPPQ